MLFNSIAYLIFLPIVFGIYWALPHKYRWFLLLISSYYFYMSWNPKYIVLILATTVVSYVSGLVIEKTNNQYVKKMMVAGATIFCMGMVFFFKYFNFFGENMIRIFQLFSIQLQPVTLNVILPVGISFYTFQTLSYVIDVYRGDVKAEHNLGIYATFISFFPQLVAGPIERSRNLLPQITTKKVFDYDLAMYGARQILWGFFKKIAVADYVAAFVDKAYLNLDKCTSFELCVTIIFFTFQIYCDFSGYSDIAIGTGKLFGINLMKNFDSPYFSTSIREFWNRWHISLSTWFKDYVYIPLGGSRCSKIRCYINNLIVFFVSGLWHGANWTFIIWGGMHGVARVIEKISGLENKMENKLKKIIGWLVVFIFCNISWVFFRAETILDACYIITNAIPRTINIRDFVATNIGISKKDLAFSFFNILIVMVFDYISLKVDIIENTKRFNKVVVIGIQYILVVLIGIALIYSVGSNQFVYFQF